MTKTSGFKPDWASAPGDTISDILHERRLNPAEIALKLGFTGSQFDELLSGEKSIDTEIAARLEKTVGGSAEFWIKREAVFQEDLSRIRRHTNPTSDVEWLQELPIRDMVKFGWIRGAKRKNEQAKECLNFFGVAGVDSWREGYADVLSEAAFRTSPSFHSTPGAVAAWLRQGELDGDAIDCDKWDPKKFETTIPEIRSLTREKDPKKFIPELRKLCARCGVAVAVVRAPTGCRASGASFFLSEDKAVIVLSFRHLSDDHIWFTFFHESGHLLLHRKEDLFVDEDEFDSTVEEAEANRFAAITLVPEEFRDEMLGLRRNAWEIARFARKIGISAGIVVGQLQHFGVIGHDQLNGLKRKYSWKNASMYSSPGTP